MLTSQPDHCGHRRPQAAVAGAGRQPLHLQRDGAGRAERVAGRVHQPAGQVTGVDVDGQGRMLTQRLQGRHRAGCESP